MAESRGIVAAGLIPTSTEAYQRLIKKYNNVADPQTGNVIRYAKTDNSTQDANGEGKCDSRDQALLKDGNNTPAGTTTHMTTFLLRNEKGVQVFTKNGSGINTPFQIKYEHLLLEKIPSYGGASPQGTDKTPLYRPK